MTESQDSIQNISSRYIGQYGEHIGVSEAVWTDLLSLLHHVLDMHVFDLPFDRTRNE